VNEVLGSNAAGSNFELVVVKTKRCEHTASELAISIFAAFYMLLIGLWLMPPSFFRNTVLKPFVPLILFSGLWQTYTVFSPPRIVNLDLQAIIFFNDGSQKNWSYPRMERLGLFDRAQKERFRKYGYDHLNSDADGMIRPDFARYLARLNDAPGHRPVSVLLIRHWIAIPPPENGLGKPLPEHSNQCQFFRYQIQPGDLQ